MITKLFSNQMKKSLLIAVIYDKRRKTGSYEVVSAREPRQKFY
jgi:hypothetical protein